MAVVLHHSRAKGSARLVMLGIANHDGDGGSWPAVSTLAKYAGGIDRRGVQRALDKLVSLGEVRRHVQAGGMADLEDHERPNRYDVLVACPPWCDRSKNHRDTRSRGQRNLWIDPAAQAPPGGADTATPAAQAPPGGAAQAPPKPSTEPDDESVGALSTDRGREPCGTCGLARWACEARAETNGHTFEPRHGNG